MAVSKTSKTTTAKDTTKDTTKTAAVQATLKVEEPVKSEPASKEAEATAKTSVAKKTATKTPAKRATTRKTTKTTAKKTTRRASAKKETVNVKADVFVQFQGMEFSEKEIMEKVVAAWEAEGKKATAIKRTKLYVKPEDGKAYFVINEGLKNGSTGAVDL